MPGGALGSALLRMRTPRGNKYSRRGRGYYFARAVAICSQIPRRAECPLIPRAYRVTNIADPCIEKAVVLMSGNRICAPQWALFCTIVPFLHTVFRGAFSFSPSRILVVFCSKCHPPASAHSLSRFLKERMQAMRSSKKRRRLCVAAGGGYSERKRKVKTDE